MGMFDKPPKLTDEYPPDSGRSFEIIGAKFIGYDSSFGNPNAVASVTVNNDGQHTLYQVFGTMAQQIERMEDGDLPAIVTIRKDGRANVLSLVQ